MLLVFKTCGCVFCVSDLFISVSLTSLSLCLLYPRNVSSDGAEARRRLRECEGLVDALLHALQSAVGKKDMDNKVSLQTDRYYCICIVNMPYVHWRHLIPWMQIS